jgi:hypothetical protein
MAIVDKMKELGIPLTRENYKMFNWLGDPPPEPLDPEIEATLPEEISTFPKDDTEEIE